MHGRIRPSAGLVVIPVLHVGFGCVSARPVMHASGRATGEGGAAGWALKTAPKKWPPGNPPRHRKGVAIPSPQLPQRASTTTQGGPVGTPKCPASQLRHHRQFRLYRFNRLQRYRHCRPNACFVLSEAKLPTRPGPPRGVFFYQRANFVDATRST